MTWLALDIGGANLKAADGLGYARSVPFPLWQSPEQLPDALRILLANGPPYERLALTMTGELADCYVSKAEGVRDIAEAANRAAGTRPVSVYLTSGGLVPVQTAIREPLLAAASNWHALATYACRYCRASGGLLIDIGSTTCDIIPLNGKRPIARGQTDPERLVNGELVYSGIERTPVCGLVRTLPFRGKECPVALEWFATTVDAYLLLGDLPEDEKNLDTPDGRPRTQAAAHARMARTLCADTTLFSEQDARVAAAAVRDAQLDRLAQAIRQVVDRLPNRPGLVILSGHGDFLAKRLLGRIDWQAPVISLRQELGPEMARCGPAHALARLAREGLGFASKVCRGPRASERAIRKASETDPAAQCARIGYTSMQDNVADGSCSRSKPGTLSFETKPTLMALRVVKVGGSLFDLPDLADRLRSWLDCDPAAHHVLVTGGGAMADQVRAWHALQPIDEETAHWICVDLMDTTARLLQSRMPELALASDIRVLERRCEHPGATIFCAAGWLRDIEPRLSGTKLSVGWETTGDAIAGRLAIALGADELVLLKSTLPATGGKELASLADTGLVDPVLPRLAPELPTIRLVDLRLGRSITSCPVETPGKDNKGPFLK